jgi:hypothetical protein
MDVETRILTLAAKKLANEATKKELRELNNLLRKNPAIEGMLNNIFDTWDSIHFDHALNEKDIDENIALVLVKIHERIKVPGNVICIPPKVC